MKVLKLKASGGRRDGRLVELPELARNALSGDYYGGGAVEEARATADNAAEALARLMNVLIARDVITPTDVQYVLYGRFGEARGDWTIEEQS